MIMFVVHYVLNKNTEIVKPDVMIGVQIPIPPLCVCEFMMTLSSRLSTQKKMV